jgi:hypothetical protein
VVISALEEVESFMMNTGNSPEESSLKALEADRNRLLDLILYMDGCPKEKGRGIGGFG